MSTDQPKQRQFTGTHMLLIMVAFFGTIIAVNLTMAMYASSSWTGLIVKNSYVASQAFNQELGQARQQAARGWTGAIEYKANGLELTVTDKAGTPVHLNNVVALVGRPAYEQSDMTLGLAAQGAGMYRADTALAPGVWQISMRGKSQLGDYRLDARLIVEKPRQ